MRIGIILAVLCLVPLGYGLQGCDSSKSSNAVAPPSPTGPEDPGQVIVVFASPSPRSGSVTENGAVTGATAAVGDSAANVATRGFLSFDLDGIPSTAEVVSSVLDVGTYTAGANDPFSSPNPLGNFNIHCAEYGSLQGQGDYDGKNLCTLYSSSTGGSALSGVDATAGVQEALSSGRARFQVRMFFDMGTNGDGVADTAIFDIDAASITVRYR